VEGPKKLESVFAHFKPSVDVELDREGDGSTVKGSAVCEADLGDFDCKVPTSQQQA